MTSHTSPRSLGSLTAAVLAGALLLAGCGDGRQSQAVVPVEPAPTPTVASAAPVAAPPVFGTEATANAAPATGEADAAAAKRSARATHRAEHRRQVAQRRLRHERNTAERARKRAVLRELALRRQLAVAKANVKATPQQEMAAPVDPSIAASDVPPNTAAQHNIEARAAVLRFHELLNDRDVESCTLVTSKLLHAIYGKDPGAMERCRSTVRSLTVPVSVVIDNSAAKGSRARVHVISRIGDQDIHQTLRLVLVSGSWLLDAVEHDPAS